MTCKLGDKLEKLDFSQTSPGQAKDIICIAISPSIAYAFSGTPCTQADLIIWDKMIDRTIKYKYNLAKSTPAAMIRDCVEYYRRSALTSSLEDPSARHCAASLHLLTKQITHLKSLSMDFQQEC